VLSIAVLGEVEARRDGVGLTVPRGKTSELLVRLAVEPGVPVRADTLVEDLWGGPVDRNTLQAKVSQLRRALGDRDCVRARGDAYYLDVAPDAVDAVRATALASASSAADDPAVRARYADEGVALFRGDPLVGQGDWATPHRTALDEVRWGLTEDLMAARVDLGGGAELVAELELLVGEQPLRERLWASLVTALYRA
jgi:DNA-binding SARP family transcriptional activator